MTEPTFHPKRDWRPLAFGVIIAALLIVGVLMRLHQLGLPFDRDGYDEGVYWQTLMAIAHGKHLYQDIFCSQPPAFLLSIYPVFLLLGKSIWSARLGIACISIIGLVGAAILGDALAGRRGAVAGLLLLLASPAYLMQSQTLQGEAPSIALSLLSVGLAYQWWKSADKKAGYYFAIFSGMALSCSIFVKLVGVCAIVPIAILVLQKTRQKKNDEEVGDDYSLLAGLVAFLFVCFMFCIPLIKLWDEFWHSAVRMYTTAQVVFHNSQSDNISLLQKVLFAPLGIAALCGTIFTIKLRDNRIFPLIGWLVVTLWMLWSKVPLFDHHLLSLIPPLIALVVLGIVGIAGKSNVSKISVNKIIPYAIVGIIVLVDGVQILRYYQDQRSHAMKQNVVITSVVFDLKDHTSANQQIITDAPFLAALANRQLPATLVDTSMVRVMTGFVTTEQLIKEANNPQVGAILFYSGRFNLKNTEDFHEWVVSHYRLARSYGHGKELWVKRS